MVSKKNENRNGSNKKQTEDQKKQTVPKEIILKKDKQGTVTTTANKVNRLNQPYDKRNALLMNARNGNREYNY